MSTHLTRPRFDAAVFRCKLPSEYHEPLWTALRLALTGKLSLDPHKPRPSWTPEAIDLREPLRREIEACRKRHAEGALFSRLDPLTVPDPITGTGVPVTLIFAKYRESIVRIQARMDHVLREGGHWRSGPVDGMSTDPRPEPQPIAVLVANEKAAGRPAGTRDWTQWEDPQTYKRTTRFFIDANKLHYQRRKWAPYTLPRSSYSERGIAADTKRAQKWQLAFHEELTEKIDRTNGYLRNARKDDPRPAKVLAFWNMLSDDPAITAAITDACIHQSRKHRTPANALFRPPRSLWHALDADVRVSIAAKFDELVKFVNEVTLARGEPLPEVPYNPFALTPDELREVSAG